MRFWLGKRLELPVVGGVYAGVSTKFPSLHPPSFRVGFLIGVALALLMIELLGVLR